MPLSDNQRQRLEAAYKSKKFNSKSADALWRRLPDIPKSLVKQWFSEQEANQQLKEVRRVKNFFPITEDAQVPFNRLQMDLLPLNSLYPTKQRGNSFLLVVIDVMSRYLFAVPLKTKGAAEVIPALNGILDQIGALGFTPPIRIDSDQERAFSGARANALFSSLEITNEQAQTHSHTQLAFVDRACRTLRSLIETFCLKHPEDNDRWIDALPDIVEGYNETPKALLGFTEKKVPLEDGSTRTVKIGIAPAEEINRTDFNRHYQELVRTKYLKAQNGKGRLKVGDAVRLLIRASDPNIFRKGTAAQWSSSIHAITAIERGVWYKVNDTPRLYKRYQLLHVPGAVVSHGPHHGQSAVAQGAERVVLQKKARVKRRIRKEGIAENSEPRAQRVRRQVDPGVYVRGE